MHAIKHTKILRSKHVSELERDFEDFCRKHQIKFEKNRYTEHRGSSKFVVVFEPPYLDSTEQCVVEYCKKKGIDMHFQRSADGMHHYEFHELVNPREDYEGSGIPDPTRVIQIRNLSSLAAMQQPQIKVVTPPKIKLKWWQYLLCAVWPKYESNMRAKNDELARKQAEEEAKEAQVKLLADWKKMAGLTPDETQIQANVYAGYRRARGED